MIPQFEKFSVSWSELHGTASTRGIVGYWLRVSYLLAKIFTKLKFTPNSLTILGLVFAIATSIFSPNWWSGFFLALSLLSDGLDGALAIVQGRATRMGAIYDAIADRLSEALWLVAFFRLGVPLGWVLTLGALAAFQEYARARLGSSGVHGVGVVTPAERPVRASLLFVAILAWQFSFSNEWVLGIAVIGTALQFWSFLLVIGFAHRSLK